MYGVDRAPGAIMPSLRVSAGIGTTLLPQLQIDPAADYALSPNSR